jgi:hypothetical protein
MKYEDRMNGRKAGEAGGNYELGGMKYEIGEGGARGANWPK